MHKRRVKLNGIKYLHSKQLNSRMLDLNLLPLGYSFSRTIGYPPHPKYECII